jgi:CheY-like chemotaxis protein
MERHPVHIGVRPRVLLAEAQDDTRALYAIALSASGFDVLPVQDGEEAYRRACEVRPDVIVSGLAVGATDGWELRERLRRTTATRDVIFVVLTADASAAVRNRAALEGCAAVIIKPCPPQQLTQTLRELVEWKLSHAHAAVRR